MVKTNLKKNDKSKSNEVVVASGNEQRVKDCLEKFLSRGSMFSRVCQWPLNEPGTPKFSFCQRPIMNKRPYCEEHCELAYRKKSVEKEKVLREKQEDISTKDDDDDDNEDDSLDSDD